MDAAPQANLAAKFYRYFRRAEGAPDRYSERGTDELIPVFDNIRTRSNGQLTLTFRKIAQSWVRND